MKNLTDDGRTIIKKKGSEESISARGNWQLWKFALTLKPEEIEMLITKRINSLKYEKNANTIKGLRRDIRLLSDVRTIIKRNPEMYSKEKRKMHNVFLLGVNLISILRLIHTSADDYNFYIEELNSCLECFEKEHNILEKCISYNEEIFASCFVTEILDYYKVSYDQSIIEEFYNDNEKDYFNLKIILNQWLSKNYWMPKLELS